MQRTVKRSRTGIAALALVGAASPAPAQTPGPEMVPLELVQTLALGLPIDGDAPPEVLVGRIPEATLRVLTLPGDSRIVGSLVYPSYSMSAIAAPGTPAAVRDAWIENLLAAGWRRYQPPSPRGFTSGYAEGLRFCMGDSAMMVLDVKENRRVGSYVRLISVPSSEFTVCRARERRRFPRPDLPIPSLTPPAGAASRGSGSGGGSEEWHSEVRLRTDLAVDALVAHYGAQLREHGWTPLERTATQGIAIETFRVTDPEGDPWYGVLVASTPSAASERFLSLRLQRVHRDR